MEQVKFFREEVGDYSILIFVPSIKFEDEYKTGYLYMIFHDSILEVAKTEDFFWKPGIEFSFGGHLNGEKEMDNLYKNGIEMAKGAMVDDLVKLDLKHPSNLIYSKWGFPEISTNMGGGMMPPLDKLNSKLGEIGKNVRNGLSKLYPDFE